MKRSPYKDQLEGLLVTNLLPAFEHSCGFMRARACWLVQKFATVEFKMDNGAVFQQIVALVLRSLVSDPELPVKVESAMAIEELLTEHEEGMRLLEPQVRIMYCTIVTSCGSLRSLRAYQFTWTMDMESRRSTNFVRPCRDNIEARFFCQLSSSLLGGVVSMQIFV
jgi:hypothetical protein